MRDDWFEVDQNSTSFFYNVTANDTYRDLNNYVHDVIDRVTSVTQSEKGGTVAISPDGQGILYSPPAGFSGNDTFTYIADGKHKATVSVQVTRPVRDDHISTGVYQDTPGGVLNVLSNDFLGNGYTGPRLITAVGPTRKWRHRHDSQRRQGRAVHAGTGLHGQRHVHLHGRRRARCQCHVCMCVRWLNRIRIHFIPIRSCALHARCAGERLLQQRLRRTAASSRRSSCSPAAAQVVIQNGNNVDVRSRFGRLAQHSLHGRRQIRSHGFGVDSQFARSGSMCGRSEFAVHQLDVLANDFDFELYYYHCPAQNYPGPRIITGVTQSVHGGVVTIAADGRSVNYQPPADFYGHDSFTYTVDGFMTGTVSVEVIRRVRDDTFRVDAADGPQTLPVLANDLFGANYSGPGQITGVTATAAGGTATIGNNGHAIVYTPPAGFVGTDTFTYTVDGALKAEVTVVVDAPATDQHGTFDSVEDYTQFLLEDALERYQYLFGQTAWNFSEGPEATDLFRPRMPAPPIAIIRKPTCKSPAWMKATSWSSTTTTSTRSTARRW